MINVSHFPNDGLAKGRMRDRILQKHKKCQFHRNIAYLKNVECDLHVLKLIYGVVPRP